MSAHPLEPEWTPQRVRDWSRYRAATLLLRRLFAGDVDKAEAVWAVQDATPAEQQQLLLDMLDVLDDAGQRDEWVPLRIRLLDLRDLYEVRTWPWARWFACCPYLPADDGSRPPPPPEDRPENRTQR